MRSASERFLGMVRGLPVAHRRPEHIARLNLAAIDGAADIDDLQKQFTAAYKAAEAAHDKAAMSSIIKRKDDRKKALAKK